MALSFHIPFIIYHRDRHRPGRGGRGEKGVVFSYALHYLAQRQKQARARRERRKGSCVMVGEEETELNNFFHYLVSSLLADLAIWSAASCFKNVMKSDIPYPQ